LEDDVEIQIVTDASPWRLGAVLVVHGNAQAYSAVPLTTDDEEQLSIQISQAAGQQLLKHDECWSRCDSGPACGNLHVVHSVSGAILCLLSACYYIAERVGLRWRKSHEKSLLTLQKVCTNRKLHARPRCAKRFS